MDYGFDVKNHIVEKEILKEFPKGILLGEYDKQKPENSQDNTSVIKLQGGNFDDRKNSEEDLIEEDKNHIKQRKSQPWSKMALASREIVSIDRKNYKQNLAPGCYNPHPVLKNIATRCWYKEMNTTRPRNRRAKSDVDYLTQKRTNREEEIRQLQEKDGINFIKFVNSSKITAKNAAYDGSKNGSDNDLSGMPRDSHTKPGSEYRNSQWFKRWSDSEVFTPNG